MTVDIEIRPTPADTGQIEFVDDLDTLSESHVCSCKAGDDNPF
jgi:hypothetical protein